MAYHYRTDGKILAVGLNSFTHGLTLQGVPVTPSGVYGMVRLTPRGGTGTATVPPIVTNKNSLVIGITSAFGFEQIDIECEAYHSVIR